MQKVINFFREARGELMKVNWPTQKELVRYTVLVIVISLAVAIFLGALDTLFSYLVERFLLTQ
jgi:preprotein translocase subunit SecE